MAQLSNSLLGADLPQEPRQLEGSRFDKPSVGIVRTSSSDGTREIFLDLSIFPDCRSSRDTVDARMAGACDRQDVGATMGVVKAGVVGRAAFLVPGPQLVLPQIQSKQAQAVT